MSSPLLTDPPAPDRYRSWGGYPSALAEAVTLRWRSAPLPSLPGRTLLPFGNGRSYGDSCLNDGGVLLDTRRLDRLIAFDPVSGLLRCEAGVLLGEILAFVVPQGWFLPVTPGTRHITVGGAIANDVHGKNHRRAGSFGHYVRRFELLRSDGSRRLCAPDEQADWFRATVGGLGLTGVIVWAELALRRIPSPSIQTWRVRHSTLRECLHLSDATDCEYAAAWVDSLASGPALGRGVLLCGDHASGNHDTAPPAPPGRSWSVPLTPPLSLLRRPVLHAFNALYYRRQPLQPERKLMHYLPFFYPLDRLGHWNRLYGRAGLLQYQCVLPPAVSEAALTELLARVTATRSAFLAVLKRFGTLEPVGLLSFPRPGVTLALDFPNRGAATLALLARLDEIVREAGGAVYPAKDARMSAATFRASFPRWQEFHPFVDPCFSSSFWRRVTCDAS